MTGKKLKHLLAAALLILPMAVAAITSSAQAVQAADGDNDTNTTNTTKVVLTKVLFADGTTPSEDLFKKRDGKPITDFKGGRVLPGVTFTAYNITKTYTPGKEKDIQDDVKDNGDANKYGTSVTDGEQKTDADGIATFELPNTDAHGNYQTYMIVETKFVADEVDANKTAIDLASGETLIERATPLILTMPLNTKASGDTVYVYPKNYEDKMTNKDLTTDSKTALGDTATGDVASASYGQTVTYTITEDIPFDIAQRDHFKVTDTPSAGLKDLVGTKDKTVAIADAQGNPVSDGTFTITANTDDGGFTATGDITALAAYAGQTLTFKYQAQVTATGVATLDNTVKTDYNNNPHFDTGKTPIYVGGKPFVKIKDGDPSTKLADAVFLLTDADGNIVVKDGDAYKSSDVKASTLDVQSINAAVADDKNQTSDDKLSAAVTAVKNAADFTGTPVVAISGEDGAFEFTGLKYGDYHAVELAAPEGYVVATTPVDFTVSATSYYKNPTAANPELAVQDIKNAPKGVLPQTGGMGIYLIIALGLAVMVAGFLFLKKGNHHEEV